jgi:hypothetical protein
MFAHSALTVKRTCLEQGVRLDEHLPYFLEPASEGVSDTIKAVDMGKID